MADHHQSPLEYKGDSQLWGHQWGFKDTTLVVNDDRSVMMTGERYGLTGVKMPGFIPFLEAELGITIDEKTPLTEVSEKVVGTVHRNKAFCAVIEASFPSSQYAFEDHDRLLHSHGQTTTTEVYKVLYGQLTRTVDMVFYCESEKDAQTLVQLAVEHDVCLVPFGGGTNVTCALQLPPSETRMIVSVDMKRMNRIEWIDPVNLKACVQAGITGKDLENQLRASGFICGHAPDSLELSTLGGWIATNASGMKKNRYGNIEQIVEKVTLVTPAGVVEQMESVSRASMGIPVQQLPFGSEGNLGLITKAVIKIHPLPEVTKYASFMFPNFTLGVEFMKRIAHSGLVPASLRLMDNKQFRLGFSLKPQNSGVVETWMTWLKQLYLFKVLKFNPTQMVVATVVMEGSAQEVDHQERNIYATAKQLKGLATGSKYGEQGYMFTFAIAYVRDFLSSYHIIGETFETTVAWDKIQLICDRVQTKLDEQHQAFNLPGKPYLAHRVTQVYHTGVCLYFIFGIYTKGVEHPEDVCWQIEHSLRQVILDNGGSISHHHGIGKIRRDFMKDVLSPAGIKLMRGVKEATDPQNIFGIRNGGL
ncbi:FAD-binding oxidoreductase [Leptothoe sp. ISB3NOV94-8A]